VPIITSPTKAIVSETASADSPSRSLSPSLPSLEGVFSPEGELEGASGFFPPVHAITTTACRSRTTIASFLNTLFMKKIFSAKLRKKSKTKDIRIEEFKN
jgi:hypothetical protein